eukprot:m.39825 g.39825  ORF g.39825 m.39825 type:complete len:104 (+) comp9595_c0_seq1:157-468(+)
MGKLQDTAKKGDVQALHEILPVSGLGKQKIINDKDSSGMTALHYASKEGHFEMVKYILEHGGDPGLTDANGHNAAYWASFNDHDKVLELLVRAAQPRQAEIDT